MFKMMAEDVFHGARYVHFSAQTGLIYVWNGNCTINTYVQEEGGVFSPVDCYEMVSSNYDDMLDRIAYEERSEVWGMIDDVHERIEYLREHGHTAESMSQLMATVRGKRLDFELAS